MTQPSSSSSMPAEASSAVQAALGAEHAAMWVYGLVSAFLPNEFDESVQAATSAHRTRRDTTERVLAAAGETPRPAEPAYVPPETVTDQASAIAVLVVAETDACVAWRAVLERTDDTNVRRLALEALTGSAVQATRWRAAAGTTPAAQPLPGRPDE